MSYFVNKEEFRTLLDHMRPGALFYEQTVEYNPVCDASIFQWVSNTTGEVRFRAIYLEDGTSTYEVVTELLPEEMKEPTPRLYLKVENFEELQKIINEYEKMRKEQENGNQG